MICRQAVGRIDEATADVDWVDLPWQQTLRRALRLTSRAGRKIDLLLPPGGRLAHGDILLAGPPPVAVNVEAADLLLIHATDPVVRARFAFDLGNRHLPTEILTDGLRTLDDGPTRELADTYGLPVVPIHARFYPEPVRLDVTVTNLLR